MKTLKKNAEVVLLNGLERNTLLNATFHDNYTSNWVFKLPRAFRKALDLAPTKRMLPGNKEVQVFTQGQTFDFKEGDVMYDHHQPYECETWADAIAFVKFSIQVVSGSQGMYSHVRDFKVVEDNEVEKVSVYRYSDGEVSFNLYTVADMKLNEFGSYTCTQTEFVRFLQQGEAILKSGEVLDIDAIFPKAYPNEPQTIRTFKRASGT